jgi:hypothetical protein
MGMLTGVFNSIIQSGFRAVRAVAGAVTKFLSKTFNRACKAVNRALSGNEHETPAEEGLHRHFNRFCNDNLSFHGDKEESAEKKARIRHLQTFLKEIMKLVALGAAHVQDALCIVQELESLGVNVGGLLVLHSHADHATKTAHRPVLAA